MEEEKHITKLTLPVFAIDRHRMQTDGTGVTTLVGAYGCPLSCKYCINPHAWKQETLKKCVQMSTDELYDRVKIDNLYFLATGGGITFGGGEALLHVDFIKEFRRRCGTGWCLTAETSLNVSQKQLMTALEAVDAFIVDIKDMNGKIYKEYTGKDNRQVLDNLMLLSGWLDKKQVRVRVPVIPAYNTKEDVQKSVEQLSELGFTDIEVFPYIIRQ